MKSDDREHLRKFWKPYSNRTRYAIFKHLAEGKSCKYIARRFNLSQQQAAAFKSNLTQGLVNYPF